MGSRLLFLRIKNNYTQSFVSNYIHCSQSAYSRYESGATMVPVDILVKLSLLYSTSVDYILCLTDNPECYTKLNCITISNRK